MIEQLGYLVFEVSDLPAWERFAEQVLGLQIVNRQSDGGFALRMDHHKQRIVLRPGPADDLAAVGWQVPDGSSLDRQVERLERAGVGVGHGTDDEHSLRAVAKFVKFTDPGQVSCELYCGPEREAAPFVSSRVPSGFVADELGLGHLVITAQDREASRRFYCDVLDFKFSDRIACELPGGYQVDIAFLHINPRHHSLAIGASLPKRIHHFLLEARDMDDVGAAYDRAKKHRIPIQNSLGRHPNDRMFSFYADTPAGFQFEFGWGGRLIEEATWHPKTYDRISLWGHRFGGGSSR